MTSPTGGVVNACTASIFVWPYSGRRSRMSPQEWWKYGFPPAWQMLVRSSVHCRLQASNIAGEMTVVEVSSMPTRASATL